MSQINPMEINPYVIKNNTTQQKTSQPSLIGNASLPKPLESDKLCFRGSSDLTESKPLTPLESCIEFAKKAGENFKKFSDRMSPLDETFSFMNKKPGELTPEDPGLSYHKALFATAESALKSYDYDKDGKITPNDMENYQKENYAKLCEENITSTKKFIQDQEELLDQLAKTDIDTTEMKKQLKEYASERELQLEEQKQQDYKSFEKFSNNWAALDGDATTISKKDMAIYLAAADAAKGTINGTITKGHDEQIAQHILKKGSKGLEVIIDQVNKYAKIIKN